MNADGHDWSFIMRGLTVLARLLFFQAAPRQNGAARVAEAALSNELLAVSRLDEEAVFEILRDHV